MIVVLFPILHNLRRFIEFLLFFISDFLWCGCHKLYSFCADLLVCFYLYKDCSFLLEHN